MRQPTRRLAAVALAAVLSGSGAAFVGSAPPVAAADRAGQAVALTTTNSLVFVEPLTPSAVARTVAVSGLQANEQLLAIDVRPATGQLYGVGSTSRLYVIDPATGVARAVGSPFTPGITGTSVGFDVDPVTDRIRLVTEAEQNLRLHPDTGAVAGADRPIAYAPGDPGAIFPDVRATAAAYTENRAAALSTSLYVVDSGRDVLALQNPPDNGTLRTVGSLGVDVVDLNGFDVAPDGTAYAVLTTSGSQPRLYTIDLANGGASARNLVGDGSAAIRGLAVLPLVDSGYRLAATDGQVLHFGSAAPPAGAPRVTPRRPIVGTASNPRGSGYWLVADDGGIFALGDAAFFGSTGNLVLNSPIVGMAPTPTGRGYWLVAADGGVFAYGDARFFGSTGSLRLNSPVVGMAATPTGLGYWLVAADGGIFAYGDATFLGSTGSLRLNRPVVGMASTPRGTGYWLVASDGGIFAYGAAPFLGSTGGLTLNRPVTAMRATSRGDGYWLTAEDGGVFAFGRAPFLGSVSRATSAPRIVGMAQL